MNLRKVLSKIFSLIVLAFLVAFCFPKINAQSNTLNTDIIRQTIIDFEKLTDQAVNKEIFYYSGDASNPSEEVSYGCDGYNRDKLNLVEAKIRSVREYMLEHNLVKPREVVFKTVHPELFQLYEQMLADISAFKATRVTGSREDLRYVLKNFNLYKTLQLKNKGTETGPFEIILSDSIGKLSECLTYYVSDTLFKKYNKHVSKIEQLIALHNDNLDAVDSEINTKVNELKDLYTQITATSDGDKGSFVDFKVVHSEDETITRTVRKNITLDEETLYGTTTVKYKSQRYTENEMLTPSEQAGFTKTVNGTPIKYLPKVYYYNKWRDQKGNYTVVKRYLFLSSNPTGTANIPVPENNTFYIEWVPEKPVAVFKIALPFPVYKGQEFVYKTVVIDFPSWDQTTIPEAPTYDQIRYLLSYSEDWQYFKDALTEYEYVFEGWYSANVLYKFNTVPTEDIVITAKFKRKPIAKPSYTFSLIHDGVEFQKIKVNYNLVGTNLVITDESLNMIKTILKEEDLYRYTLTGAKLKDETVFDYQTFDYNTFNAPLKNGNGLLLYDRTRVYKLEYNFKNIYLAGDEIKFKTVKYFASGEIINDDLRDEVNKYCQNPKTAFELELDYWVNKETGELFDFTAPLPSRNINLEPVLKKKETPFVPIETLHFQKNSFSIAPFDTDYYELRIPYSVYPSGATEKFEVLPVNIKDHELLKLFAEEDFMRIEGNEIVLKFPKTVYDKLFTRLTKQTDGQIVFKIVPNSQSLPGLNFGIDSLVYKQTLAEYKGINSVFVNIQGHSSALNEKLEEAKAYLSSRYLSRAFYDGITIPLGSKVVTDERLYSRLVQLIEFAELILRKTQRDFEYQMAPKGSFDKGNSYNSFLKETYENLKAVLLALKSNEQTVTTDNGDKGNTTFVFYNHDGSIYRKFLVHYNVGIKLPSLTFLPRYENFTVEQYDKLFHYRFSHFATKQQTFDGTSKMNFIGVFDFKNAFPYFDLEGVKVVNFYPQYSVSQSEFKKLIVEDIEGGVLKTQNINLMDNVESYEQLDFLEFSKQNTLSGINYVTYENLVSEKHLLSLKNLKEILRLEKKHSERSDIRFTVKEKKTFTKTKEELVNSAISLNKTSKVENGAASFMYVFKFKNELDQSTISDYLTNIMLVGDKEFVRDYKVKITPVNRGFYLVNFMVYFKFDSVKDSKPDYQNFSLKDLFGEPLDGSELTALFKHDVALPASPITKEKLELIKTLFTEVMGEHEYSPFENADFVRYGRKVLPESFSGILPRALENIESKLNDGSLTQEEIDTCVRDFFSVYQYISNASITGRNHDISPDLLDKLNNLKTEIQTFEGTIETTSYEESTEIGLTLPQTKKEELTSIVSKLNAFIAAFPVNPQNGGAVTDTDLNNLTNSFNSIKNSVLIPNSFIENTLNETLLLKNDCEITSTPSLLYTLKKGKKYLTEEDMNLLDLETAKLQNVNTEIVNFNTLHNTNPDLTSLKLRYESVKTKLTEIKSRVIIGTWEMPNLTALTALRNKLVALKEMVNETDSVNPYLLETGKKFLEKALYSELIEDINEINHTLNNASTLFQSDIDAVKNLKEPNLKKYEDRVIFGAKRFVELFKAFKDLKQNVKKSEGLPSEKLPDGEKFVTNEDYALLEKDIENLNTMISSETVNKDTIEADLAKFENDFDSIKKRIIIGKNDVDISMLKEFLIKVKAFKNEVKHYRKDKVQKGDQCLLSKHYNELTNMIDELEKKTEDDFKSGKELTEYLEAKNKRFEQIKGFAFTYSPKLKTTLLAVLIPLGSLILIATIVIIVVKKKRTKKEPKNL